MTHELSHFPGFSVDGSGCNCAAVMGFSLVFLTLFFKGIASKMLVPTSNRDALWGQACALHWAGVPVGEIAGLLECSRHVIYSCIRERLPPSLRSRKSRKSPHRASVSRRRQLVKKLAQQHVQVVAKKTVQARGRPRKDGTPRASYVVEKVLLKSKFGSPAAVKRELNMMGFDVGKTTVRNDFLACGLKAYRRPSACALTDSDAARRLLFANKVVRFPAALLRGIIFSDEKWFDSNDRGDVYQWATSRKAIIPREHIQAPAKVFVWGAIAVGWRFLKVIDVADEGLNAKRYREECLAAMPRKRGATALQQDGAKVHWTPENVEYIHKKMKLKTVDGWPPHSPDLNPVEHMWSIVQRAVCQRGPWGKEELVKMVVEEWNKVPQTVVNKLVLSFKKRCEECRTAKGKHIQSQ